jgi:hypothetical protein
MSFADFFHEHYLKTPLRGDVWVGQLQRKGWVASGRGCFGKVFRHPDKDYVYKIYGDDFGYDFFIKFLLENQGKEGVVRMKRVVLQQEGNDKVHPNIVALEELRPLRKDFSHVFVLCEFVLRYAKDVYKPGMGFTELLEGLVRYVDNIVRVGTKEKGGYERMKVRKSRMISRIIRNSDIINMPVVSVIFDLFVYKMQNASSAVWDLHSGNLMIRPSTGVVVLTDPFC